MLVLKGKQGKSRIVEILLKNTKSIAYVYYYKPMSFDSYFISSKMFGLEEVVRTIRLDTLDGKPRNFEYFIVYTNEEEHNLGLIEDALLEFESNGICRIGIVTCK
jgi:hypothetical protein